VGTTDLPQRCVWLVAEALRHEARAAEFDRSGSAAEAAFYHQRASAKVSEAAELIPDGHPDRPALDRFVQELSIRVVYLQSLSGSPITLPLEDHVGEVSLGMDISSAPPPEEEAVPALLAKGGTSGGTAPLTDGGYELVRALQSGADMQAFIRRVVAAEGRRVQRQAEAEFNSFVARYGSDGRGLADLRGAVRLASWAELDLDPTMDKLQAAVELEKDARMLEERDRREEAADMYRRSLAVFQYVYKHDARMRSAKVKEMVAKRLEDLASCVERLQSSDGAAEPV